MGTYCGCLGCQKPCQQLPLAGGCSYACSSCLCFASCECSTGYGRLDITVSNGYHIRGSPYLLQIVNAVGAASGKTTAVLETNRTTVAGIGAGIYVQASDKNGMDCTQGDANISVFLAHQSGDYFISMFVPVQSLSDGLFVANFTGYIVGMYPFQAYLDGVPISGGLEVKGTVVFGTDTSLTLDISASNMDSFYIGYWILITFNEFRQLTTIVEYSGLSKRCTLSDSIEIPMNSSFKYELFNPQHVISVVPGTVSPEQTLVECNTVSRSLLFLDGSSCGLDVSAIASTSFQFLIILRDSFSNELTTGIGSDRLSIKITRSSSKLGVADIVAVASQNWCNEPALLSSEQCFQQLSIFQCRGQSLLFSTARCGGQCTQENCSLSSYVDLIWHQDDGSFLVEYSGRISFNNVLLLCQNLLSLSHLNHFGPHTDIS